MGSTAASMPELAVTRMGLAMDPGIKPQGDRKKEPWGERNREPSVTERGGGVPERTAR
jgi:hypothetical protein